MLWSLRARAITMRITYGTQTHGGMSIIRIGSIRIIRNGPRMEIEMSIIITGMIATGGKPTILNGRMTITPTGSSVGIVTAPLLGH
jgi:hypothetical protein